MIHPSYSELIQAINNNVEEDDNTMMLNSRYSLVLATSKRARHAWADSLRLHLWSTPSPEVTGSFCRVP